MGFHSGFKGLIGDNTDVDVKGIELQSVGCIDLD